MKAVVLGGFLGSGKTSVLLHLAHCLVERYGKGEGTTVAILENEVSSNGVDSQLLASQGYTVTDVFGGCACCTGSGLMVDNAKRVARDLQPQWLLIESSGMALPGTVAELITNRIDLEYCKVVTLVDAKRWKRIVRAMEQLIADQLEPADVVLVTKADLAEPEDLERALSQSSAMAPRARVQAVVATAPYEREAWDGVVDFLEGGQ